MKMTNEDKDYTRKYDDLAEEMRNRFKGLYLNSFFVSGLANNIDENWVKTSLYKKGYVDFVKTENLGVMAISSTNNLLNYYDEPTSIMAANENSTIIKPLVYKIGEFSRVYANSVKKAPLLIVECYVAKLVNIEKIINQQIAQFRWGIFVNVGDKEKSDVDQLFNKLDAGNEEIPIFDNALGSLQPVIKSSYPPYYVGELYKYKKSIESDLLTEIGIDSDPIQKESGVSDLEASANDDEVSKTKNANIRELKKGFEKVNTMFGLKISVSENMIDKKPMKEEDDTNGKKTD